ncbi:MULTISPECIES: DUF3343 domain-containing protein [Paenibacillus]|uniref:DUF3343 domain-containing protein n=1 Tax=Paenibacillus elgii TaxID=189691 RepID=A0A163Y3D0_9BACL|nr:MULTISPECIES: DUF3343 domain-containing protein [Paenibacillus]KPV57936.1 hypothetical protein QJ48_19375 [Paenibacillus sp. A3]KZE78836.1 hypothetical protein AV654_18780 [Paenibacillus elgii]MCM3273942.1 DUF3343 domain-containing protein [Paenibacillus elgii]NEN84994.1 DUF3343 domain-containing protein [Paenibacillus elgii]PUA34680.1 DUF3343 domain-containing protein [Paenibacillus elgii]
MLLMAFDSTQQALRAEMLLDYADIENDMCPTPKEITAGCALSLEFQEADLPEVKRIIKEERVDIHGLYSKEDGHYVNIEL